MAKNVIINGVVYNDVPAVNIPQSGGGDDAIFFDTSDADAVAGDILSGKSAYNGNGKVAGSMVNNGAISEDISAKAQEVTVPAGYHNGSGKVKISATEQAKIIADNIKSGATILGISGKSSVVDTADADATAGNILDGKTAYVNGAKLTGTLTTVSVSQDSTTKVLTIE